MGRILAIDFGEKRIGIALSDPLQIVATPHSVITHVRQKDDFAKIAAICEAENVDLVIVGLPTDSSGDIGPQAGRVIQWAEKLAKVLPMPIEFSDETASSQFARDLRPGQREQRTPIDHIAAAKILQDYLLAHEAGYEPFNED